MPRVTVITATYNGTRYLAAAIDSVLAQSLADFEYIIINDGSTDGTAALLQEYAARDPRIRLVQREQASGGPTVPKNMGLALACAPYVCFLDHDDYFHPDKLARLCDGMDAHPEWVGAFHDVQLVEEDGKPHSGTYLSNAAFKQIAASHLAPLGGDWHGCGERFYEFMSLRYAAMHTISVILAPGRLLRDPVSFRARFRGSDDTDLWLRVGFQGQLGYLDQVLAYYRQHGSNLSSDNVAMTANAVALHEDNYLRAQERLRQPEMAAYRKKILSYRNSLGYGLNRAGRYADARAVYRGMLRTGPSLRALRGIGKSWLLQLLGR
jgi:glycosyltransferase involved in cell wall biosynthesis